MASRALPRPDVAANDNFDPPLPPSGFAGARLERWVRPAIEQRIEYLLAVLDAIDGDTDLEDDDPTGAMDEDGVNTGRVCEFDRERFTLLAPNYDDDQSLGPNNYNAASKEWRMQVYA